MSEEVISAQTSDGAAEWFVRNPEKNIEIIALNEKYNRYPIKTHYVQVGKDNYIDLVKKYVLPVYKEGDIVSISEKVVSICEGKVVYKKDVKVGAVARFLCKFVHGSVSVGLHLAIPEKMQVAIDQVGVPRILLAAFCAAVTRPFGRHGVFYKVAGRQAAGVDGFESDGFDDYLEMAILCPDNSDEVCEDIKAQTGVRCMIVDANDLGVEILGAAKDIPYSIEELKSLIRDNPACQENECTPFVVIRKADENNAKEEKTAFESAS
ncbi:MAG TPA: coenzyme F420-0:L-glutamate ligase [Caproicibacter sp.]|nr:coenzyme F420-0:L-glutamate ligase [Caproicibacter sp.]